MSRISAVVPVKGDQFLKQRLAGRLGDRDRQRLSQAMLEDVLDALCAATLIGRVVIVTPETQQIDVGIKPGVAILREPVSVRGMNAALRFAAETCARDGDAGILIVPLDVPLITARDVDTLIATAPAPPSVGIVPARDLGGTNALLIRPPDALPDLHYGPGSFRAHFQAGVDRRIPTAVLELPNIALDIDTPDDLTELLARPGETRAQRLLRSIETGRREVP